MAAIHPQARAAQVDLVRHWARENDVPSLDPDDVVTTRQTFRRLADVKLTQPPPDVERVQDIELRLRSGPRPARLYRPHSRGKLPTIVFIHGGCFAIGGLDETDAEVRRLAAGLPANIVSLTYRLAPEHPWPAAIDDVTDAIAAIADGTAGFRPDRLGVAGVSAGANAAVGAVRRLIADGAPPPNLLALLSPWLDLTLTAPSCRLFGQGYTQETADLERYRAMYVPAGMDFAHPELSPAHQPVPSGWPPTVMLAAECDPMADDAALFARRLDEAGVSFELRYMRGMLHGSHTWFQRIPALEPDLDWLDRSIRRHLEWDVLPD